MSNLSFCLVPACLMLPICRMLVQSKPHMQPRIFGPSDSFILSLTFAAAVCADLWNVLAADGMGCDPFIRRLHSLSEGTGGPLCCRCVPRRNTATLSQSPPCYVDNREFGSQEAVIYASFSNQ
eukprot:scaffold16372_cov17-Prasinocladus_malaysianus.AAC.1